MHRAVAQHPQTYLWLVADHDVVLHGVGDIVDVELQVRPLRDPHKSYACPRWCAVLRVLALYYIYALRKEGKEILISIC